MNAAGATARPGPRAAHERWLDSLARAGWSARSGAGGEDAERVPVDAALGRVTAEPVIARWPSPRSACAAMDGIAMASAGGHGAGGHGAGGHSAVRVPAGAFEWIDTGDPMPDWADTVIERERLTQEADGGILIAMSPARRSGSAGHGSASHQGSAGQNGSHEVGARGRNVRQAGEDFMAGEVLVPAGRRLRPGDLAAAAAGGQPTLAVQRRPVVAIIPTGDEIRPIGATLRRGDIMDTNSLMLAGRCRQLGADPVISDVVPDDPDALATEIRRAAMRADLVLVIAGSSRGRGDHAGAVLAQVGGVAVAGVAVRPGHPALLGHVKLDPAGSGQPAAAPARRAERAGIAPVIGLPGYPLATAVIFELFGVPLLAMLAGHAPGQRPLLRVRLDRDWSSRPGTEDWVLVTLRSADDGGPPWATPASRGAGSISQLARADAWWPISADHGGLVAGTEIEVMPIPGAE